MKIKMLLSILILGSSVVLASDSLNSTVHSSSPDKWSSFYIGTLSGGTFAELEEITTIDYAALNLSQPFPGRSVCLRGLQGGIMGGYGVTPFKEQPNLYLGTELSYTRGRTKGGARYRSVPFMKVGLLHVIDGNMGQSYNQKDALKFVARVGWTVKTEVSQFMPFVQVGLENGEFSREVYDNTVDVLGAVKVNLGTKKWSKRHTAPLVGGGVDFDVTKNVKLGFAFSFAFYHSTDRQKTTKTITPQEAAAIAAAAAAVPGIPPAMLPVAGQQIETVIQTKPKMSRGVQMRLIYQF